jgi:ribonuclease VapC
MTVAVLDASAVIALLRNEPGREVVEQLLPDSAITTINLSEVVGYYARSGNSADAIHELLDPLPFERFDLNEDLAFVAGALLPVTKPFGLSIGDRSCLALAIRLGAPALTADRSWGRLPPIDGLTVKLIR